VTQPEQNKEQLPKPRKEGIKPGAIGEIIFELLLRLAEFDLFSLPTLKYKALLKMKR